MVGVCIEGPSRRELVFWKFYARELGTFRFDFADLDSMSDVCFRPLADVRIQGKAMRRSPSRCALVPTTRLFTIPSVKLTSGMHNISRKLSCSKDCSLIHLRVSQQGRFIRVT